MSAATVWASLFGLTSFAGVLLVVNFFRYRHQCILAEGRHADAELKLRQQSRDLKVILDSSPAFIWFKDCNNKILRINETAAKSIGVDVAFVEGRQTEEFYPEQAAKYLQDDREVVTKGAPKLNIVEQYQDANGEKRWVRTDKVPYRDESGKVIGVVVFSLDVTEQKQVEIANGELAAQEKIARLESERLGRIKDEFLITLSHELRTPLVPILGWIDLIKSEHQLSPEVSEALGVIERNARAELSLVEDILDVSRVVSGKLSIDADMLDLRPLIDEALQAIEVAAKAKKITLTSYMRSSAYVNGDAKRLRQILWNLLSNAIKFTPEGGVIDIELVAGDGRAIITVADNGVGISPEFLPYVFEPFRQQDAQCSRKFGGLGLGLSLCKYLVEAHGGTISVESEGRDKGARFTVSLPIFQAALMSQPAKTDDKIVRSGRLDGLRILLIDDREDELAVTSALLGRESADVATAHSAASGLSALAEFRPDIIICDIGMPEKDGFYFLSALKSQASAFQVLPVIALTAYGGEDMKARCLAAGFSGFLTKPADARTLVDSILANLDMHA